MLTPACWSCWPRPGGPPRRTTASATCRPDGRIEVTLEDGKLTGRWGRQLVRLEHYHVDAVTVVRVEPKDEIFTSDRATGEWQFRLGANGKVEGLKALSTEFKKLPAKK